VLKNTLETHYHRGGLHRQISHTFSRENVFININLMYL